jgi:uncharacterized protein YceK
MPVGAPHSNARAYGNSADCAHGNVGVCLGVQVSQSRVRNPHLSLGAQHVQTCAERTVELRWDSLGVGRDETMCKIVIVMLAIVLASGCGSGITIEQPNPCATAGATYMETLTQTSGNCGPMPSQVVNISSSGILTLSKSFCATTSESGCTSQDSDCTFSSQVYDFTEAFSLTFAQDGSSASGTLSLSGNGVESGNGVDESCDSSYSVTATRQ